MVISVTMTLTRISLLYCEIWSYIYGSVIFHLTKERFWARAGVCTYAVFGGVAVFKNSHSPSFPGLPSSSLKLESFWRRLAGIISKVRVSECKRDSLRRMSSRFLFLGKESVRR